MNEPKRPADKDPPAVPEVDERANEAFLDTLFDTDGRPNRDAETVVEIEGVDDEDDEGRP